MSCYVGDYYTKFEPFSGEEMGTHYNFEAISAGSSRRIARFDRDPNEVEASRCVFVFPTFNVFIPE
jgi:hypothetical protein